MSLKMSTVSELGRCKVSAEACDRQKRVQRVATDLILLGRASPSGTASPAPVVKVSPASLLAIGRIACNG